MMRSFPMGSRSIPGISQSDRITRLYNRQGFISASAHLLQGTSPTERWAFLLSLEINHWKVINHALGTETGNTLLMQTAASLRAIFRRSAVIGRLGMDRFAVLARVASPAACAALLERLTEPGAGLSRAVDRPHLSLRGGFTQFDPQFPVSIPRLLQDADARLNAAAAAPARESQ
jgi:diguanylate cyclase (GGDEF)-like protein